MCDTTVVLGDATASGVTLFGKNSDRDPNEAHFVLSVPAASHPVGSRLKCTYLEIPQVEHTHAVLLAKPFWMWGAEMGVNEHGVAIGNEAVYTKVPAALGEALLGMDLVRLALERSATSREAVDVITALLTEHGQGGNCGFTRPLFYDNSFLIADPHEAWVLETAGRHWAAKRVSGVYTISNGLTLTTRWDLASPDLVAYALRQGWCEHIEDFDFARCYSDPDRTAAAACTYRRQRSREMLVGDYGAVTVATVMRALRDHGGDGSKEWSPASIPGTKTVCMHATGAQNQLSQTTGSLVAHLDPEQPTCFVTGTAAPCTSLFKPVWPDIPVPGQEYMPGAKYDENSLFWCHERLHRTTLQNFPILLESYREERDHLERQFIAEALEQARADPAHRAALSKHCFEEAAQSA